MSSQIIVGVDPYRDETGPIALGAVLARATGAKLRLVAVYPDQTGSHTLGREQREEAAHRHALTSAEKLLARAGASDSEVGGVRYSLKAIPGSPARTLHALADRAPAALLVVGSTHRGPVGRLLPGSVTERVVHGAPCPVAVAPRGFGDPAATLRRIGVAYAGTDEGRQALQSAAVLAERSGAQLEAITVVDPIVFPSVPPIEATDEELSEQMRRADANVRRSLSELKPRVDGEVNVIGRGGVPELVDMTRDLDLLICGSRGYGPRMAVLLGGVSHTLVRQAHCPLIVIPRGADYALKALMNPERVAA